MHAGFFCILFQFILVLSICLDLVSMHFTLYVFYFFIYMHAFQETGSIVHIRFTHYLCTVHGTHNHFIHKKILKIDFMALFTHLKIILL